MKKQYCYFLIVAFLTFSIMSYSQTVVHLYTGSIPNARMHNKQEEELPNQRVAGVTNPTLTVFLPEKSNPTKVAVIICPGGGYIRLSIGHEGYEMAKAFNKIGIAAFVLKYRLPNDSFMTNKEWVPLQDAEQAIKLVRENAGKWNINPDKVGIVGFSAGGHVASTLATHYKSVVIENKNSINLRPDFVVLGYPVISMNDSLCHAGSRERLLGKNPSSEKIKLFSNELQVTSQTPPTFLVQAADDKSVNVLNSIVYFEALQRNKVPAEMHIYEKGSHGFGLHNTTTQDQWFDRLTNWLLANGFINGL